MDLDIFGNDIYPLQDIEDLKHFPPTAEKSAIW